jgi:hypothetical protein
MTKLFVFAEPLPQQPGSSAALGEHKSWLFICTFSRF